VWRHLESRALEEGTMDHEADWRCGCYANNFGYYPVSIGEGLKNFEQEKNMYPFTFLEDYCGVILWRMR